eukprot:6416601-Amphidinium_carterae.1
MCAKCQLWTLQSYQPQRQIWSQVKRHAKMPNPKHTGGTTASPRMPVATTITGAMSKRVPVRDIKA